MTVILHALLLEIPEKLESERLTLAAARAGQGAELNAAVVESQGGLHTIDRAIPKFEMGYWIRTSCARQGYATELADSCMYARVF